MLKNIITIKAYYVFFSVLQSVKLYSQYLYLCLYGYALMLAHLALFFNC